MAPFKINIRLGDDFLERAAEPAVLEREIAADERYLQELRLRLEAAENDSERAASEKPDVDQDIPREDPLVKAHADVGRQVGRLGEKYRLAGRYAEALACKDEALQVWRKLGREQAICLARIRRAVVLSCGAAQDGPEAFPDDGFSELHALCGETASRAELASYQDAVHEARAYAYARAGDLGRAVRDLETALGVRELRRNERAVERTRALLVRLRKRRDAG